MTRRVRRSVRLRSLPLVQKIVGLPVAAEHLVHPEVRRFAYDDLDRAIDWATALERRLLRIHRSRRVTWFNYQAGSAQDPWRRATSDRRKPADPQTRLLQVTIRRRSAARSVPNSAKDVDVPAGRAAADVSVRQQLGRVSEFVRASVADAQCSDEGECAGGGDGQPKLTAEVQRPSILIERGVEPGVRRGSVGGPYRANSRAASVVR